jgi:hypothetical protein
MNIKTADDVQLLVEDFGWKLDDKVENRNALKEINAAEHRRVSVLINQRVWDETFDDEMAITARFDAAQRFTNFDKAIDAWFERESE